jgi:hypothetical protein
MRETAPAASVEEAFRADCTAIISLCMLKLVFAKLPPPPPAPPPLP